MSTVIIGGGGGKAAIDRLVVLSVDSKMTATEIEAAQQFIDAFAKLANVFADFIENQQ